MKRKIAGIAGAGVLALSLVLTSCSSNADSGAPTATDDAPVVTGGTFRHAVSSDIGSIVPMTATQPQEIQVITYAYETLLYQSRDGEPQGWLAESWETGDGGKSVTFTLKEGVTFHDGTPFDGAVAAENINYHANPESATIFADVMPAGVHATGEGNTLTVTADVADPFLSTIIGSIKMVGSAGLADPQSLESASNGTGLFKLTSASAGKYDFERRSDYTWGPEGVTSDTEGLPEAIEVSVVADTSTRANLLLSGEINAAAIEGPDQARLDGAGLSFEGTINPIGQMLFNERADRPTHDERVRQALVLGFNHDEAKEVVTGGRPYELTSWITDAPFTCFSEQPVWDRPSSDPAQAAKLLDEAGWVAGADGTRSKDGKPLTINFIYDAGSTQHASAAELVAEDWKALGMQTELIAMDGAAWSEYLYETFDYDTGWIQIGVGSPVTQDLFYGGASPEDGGLNFMGVDDPEYKALAQQARVAADEAAACELWKEAEKVVVENTHTFLLAGIELPTYESGASFDVTDYLQPITIRMSK